ncbi:hypothetical protein [Micromonospora sp. NPDC005174]|uniref:hypothetical protein n=1 Tax=Micromonospora sp. NPDC005174 TaxID=3157018 RepID=UPI0033BCB806
MGTTTEAREFSYTVSGWVWGRQKATVLRNARIAARRKRLRADGEPEVHVTLVWPQDTDDQLPMEHC